MTTYENATRAAYFLRLAREHMERERLRRQGKTLVGGILNGAKR